MKKAPCVVAHAGGEHPTTSAAEPSEALILYHRKEGGAMQKTDELRAEIVRMLGKIVCKKELAHIYEIVYDIYQYGR